MNREIPAKSLDTAAVVHEAIRAADQRGLKDLTMRRLAARLDVQAMSLYRHVEGRDALLDAMVAATMNQLTATMTPHTFSSTTGTVYLQGTAYDVRTLALTHPWLMPLMLRRPAPAKWLSRPLCSLACTESFFEALHHRGFDIDASASIYRSFNAFLLGHLLVEASVFEDDLFVRNGRLGESPPPLHLTKAFPMLATHRELLVATDFPAEFERSLHAFLSSVSEPQPGTDSQASTDQDLGTDPTRIVSVSPPVRRGAQP